jgi:hypothetical protein
MTLSEQQFLASTTKAARSAGFMQSKQAGYTLMLRLHVRTAVEAQQAAMIQECSRKRGKGITITRNDIINRLDQLSQKAKSESARIAALAQLVNIFGLSAKSINETDLFAGWTNEELDYYRTHDGQIPPTRKGSEVGNGHGDSGAVQPAAAKTD